MKKFLVSLILLFLISVNEILAQCAMCRAQLENNVSHGETAVASGLNLGILYLFAAPYLAFGVLAFFWYRASKKNMAKRNWIERRLRKG